MWCAKGVGGRPQASHSAPPCIRRWVIHGGEDYAVIGYPSIRGFALRRR
jgi:hypothetical protein